MSNQTQDFWSVTEQTKRQPADLWSKLYATQAQALCDVLTDADNNLVDLGYDSALRQEKLDALQAQLQASWERAPLAHVHEGRIEGTTYTLKKLYFAL